MCVTVVQDVDSEGSCACMGTGDREELFTFCSILQTVLKNKMSIKKMWSLKNFYKANTYLTTLQYIYVFFLSAFSQSQSCSYTLKFINSFLSVYLLQYTPKNSSLDNEWYICFPLFTFNLSWFSYCSCFSFKKHINYFSSFII